jgi:hypothetical protein
MPIDLGDIPSGTSPSPGEKLQIRKAIGVGTTDSPAFAGLSTTGSAGIGTASPASGLHISGALGTNVITYDSAAALKLTNTTGNSSWLLTSGVIGVVNGSFSIRQDSNSQPALIISGVGNNVGIGVNAPAAKLDILDTTLSGSGSLAGSALNIAQTWNTSGTPTAIKLNVTETGAGSNAASLLMDLQVTGVSAVKVTKNGLISISDAFSSGGFVFRSGNSAGGGIGSLSGNIGVWAGSGGAIGFSTGAPLGGAIQVSLYTDAAGILAQRNGVLKQAFRVYNTNLSGAPEWAEFDWITSGTGNTLKIGTNKSGDGVARPIDFVTGGVVRMSIAAAGAVVFQGTVTASGLTVGQDSYYFHANRSAIGAPGVGIHTLMNNGGTDYNRLQLGGTTSAFPAIKRFTTGLQARLADDSAFTNIQGKLTTDTAYTGTVVVPTGFLTLYDSTGQAYRVPCVV